MTLYYIMLPIAILLLSDLNIRQKLLLALVIAFRDRGLKMSNGKLGEILDVKPSRISELLKDMELKKYIEITNKQSRWRRIYFRENPKVSREIPSTESESRKAILSTFTGFTLDESRNINKKNNNTLYTNFSFILRNGQAWTLPQVKLEEYKQTYPSLDVEAELRKAAQWLKDNPQKRKTVKGMPRFLGGWLGRAKPVQQKQNNKSRPFLKVEEAALCDKYIAENAPTEKEAEKLMQEVGII
jgi:DNA-binding MarR family transcriptional regulator